MAFDLPLSPFARRLLIFAKLFCCAVRLRTPILAVVILRCLFCLKFLLSSTRNVSICNAFPTVCNHGMLLLHTNIGEMQQQISIAST